MINNIFLRRERSYLHMQFLVASYSKCYCLGQGLTNFVSKVLVVNGKCFLLFGLYNLWSVAAQKDSLRHYENEWGCLCHTTLYSQAQATGHLCPMGHGCQCQIEHSDYTHVHVHTYTLFSFLTLQEKWLTFTNSILKIWC